MGGGVATERLSAKDQREIERQALLRREKELREKILRIETYPGDLAEYNQLTGKTHEIIPVSGPKRFLEGGFLAWRTIDRDGVDLTEPVGPGIRDLLNPSNWKRIKLDLDSPIIRRRYPGLYSKIKADAVELGADAIIHYRKQQDVNFGSSMEYGVPVRESVSPLK